MAANGNSNSRHNQPTKPAMASRQSVNEPASQSVEQLLVNTEQTIAIPTTFDDGGSPICNSLAAMNVPLKSFNSSNPLHWGAYISHISTYVCVWEGLKVYMNEYIVCIWVSVMHICMYMDAKIWVLSIATDLHRCIPKMATISQNALPSLTSTQCDTKLI